jgi:hypothetical protein
MSTSGTFTNRPSSSDDSDDESNSKKKPQLSLSQMLGAKRSSQAIPAPSEKPTDIYSWQREISKDPSLYSESQYILPKDKETSLGNKQAQMTLRIPEIVIPESLDFIGTRIWDCATYCAKMFEFHANQVVNNQWMNAPSSSSEELHPKLLDFRGKNVLELGAGCGLTAIALSHLVGPNGLIVATEYGPITSWLRKCVQRNGVLKSQDNADLTVDNTMPMRVVVEDLDWFNPDHLAKIDSLGPYDIVLMSDCTLNAKEIPTILSIFKRFISSASVLGIVGVCRERDGTSRFFEEGAKDFDMKRLEGEHPQYGSKRLEVWTMRLK